MFQSYMHAFIKPIHGTLTDTHADRCPFIVLLTDLLTRPVARSLIHSLTHSLTQALKHLFFQFSCLHSSLLHLFVHSFILSASWSVMHSPIHSFHVSLIRSSHSPHTCLAFRSPYLPTCTHYCIHASHICIVAPQLASTQTVHVSPGLNF